MKKIRLDLHALAVESFDTARATADARGTVHAHRPPWTEGFECESIDICTVWYCSNVTDCGTCYDATCGATYCGTCDPCVCGCACCGCNPCCCTCCC